MNKETIKEQLNQILTKVKQEWAKLSENDFEKVKSSYQGVKSKLQKKYEDNKEGLGKNYPSSKKESKKHKN